MKFILTHTEVSAIVRKQFNLPENVTVVISRRDLDAAKAVAEVAKAETERVIALVGGLIPHNKIAAIKEYRTVAGVGLREAKDVVENWYDAVVAIRKHVHMVVPTYSGYNITGFIPTI